VVKIVNIKNKGINKKLYQLNNKIKAKQKVKKQKPKKKKMDTKELRVNAALTRGPSLSSSKSFGKKTEHFI
jgi:hypothetical protein